MLILIFSVGFSVHARSSYIFYEGIVGDNYRLSLDKDILELWIWLGEIELILRVGYLK
jgi:hypothetical protein